MNALALSSNDADVISKFIFGVLGLIISILLYKHHRQQRDEQCVRAFSIQHELFWKEAHFAEVRAWIACQKAYDRIRPILVKRKKIQEGQMPADTMEPGEYDVLEKIDKFCNLMIRVKEINPQTLGHRILWKRMFFNYWVFEGSNEIKRPELRWYLQQFYPELLWQLI